MVLIAGGGCHRNVATGRTQLLLLSTSDTIALGEESKGALIDQYGGEILDIVDVDTTFVVAGDRRENRPEDQLRIRDARDYRVRILEMEELRRYVADYLPYPRW